jgi:electron transport complex protein RnfE
VFILIIAALVTVVDLAFNAWLHELYLVLGIFIPLIVTNCIVLARVEAFAAKNGLRASTFDGLMMGIGFVCVIALLGAVREVDRPGDNPLRHRNDFSDAFRDTGIARVLPRIPHRHPAARRLLHPRLLIAGRNWLDARANQRLRDKRLHEHPPAATTASA